MAEANQPYLEDDALAPRDDLDIPDVESDLDNDSLALPDDDDDMLEDTLPGSEPDVLDGDPDLDDDNDETGIGVIDDLNSGDTDDDNETGMITPAL